MGREKIKMWAISITGPIAQTKALHHLRPCINAKTRRRKEQGPDRDISPGVEGFPQRPTFLGYKTKKTPRDAGRFNWVPGDRLRLDCGDRDTVAAAWHDLLNIHIGEVI